MTSAATTLAVYCGLILLASLAGGWIPIVIKLTHKRMEIAVSFVAGVMLGVGVLHMLPHALMARMDLHHDHDAAHLEHAAIHQLMGPVLLWLIVGFLAMFLIERFFRHHHHDVSESECDRHHSMSARSDTRHRRTWAGAAIGLSLHSLIDGIALASSVEAVPGGTWPALAGLATFIVIFLHRPLDAMTLGTLLSISGRGRAMRHMVNIAFALMIPVGVLLFHLGLGKFESREIIISAGLAFSAGTFLCISMSDLLPELQFHEHDRVKLSLALLAGLALAWAMSVLESGLH